MKRLNWIRRLPGHVRTKPAMDYWILIGTAVLVVFGIIMVYSASYYSSAYKYGDASYILNKHIIGVVAGAALLAVFSIWDYRTLANGIFVCVFTGVVILMLCLVLVVGSEYYGAQRWLDLKVFTIQPGEIAKIAVVLFVARFVSKHPERAKHLLAPKRGMLPCVGLMLLFAALLLAQPNFSMLVIMVATFVVMLVVAQVPGKQIWLSLAAVVAVFVLCIVIEPYRMQRFMVFLNPWADPSGNGYQLIQSFYAISSGGLFGRGLGFSRQKLLYLPFSESDFIFPIIVEEWGIVGAILLLAVYLLVIYRGIQVALRCNTRFGSLMAAGISAMLAIQVIVNVMVVTGCMPPTGLPLPFISYGNSSLFVFMSSIGVLLNISRDCAPRVKRVRHGKGAKAPLPPDPPRVKSAPV